MLERYWCHVRPPLSAVLGVALGLAAKRAPRREECNGQANGGKTSTWSSTDRDTTYGKNAPAATRRPSGKIQPPASPAAFAAVVRYGPRKTVTTVVEKAEFAQS